VKQKLYLVTQREQIGDVEVHSFVAVRLSFAAAQGIQKLSGNRAVTRIVADKSSTPDEFDEHIRKLLGPRQRKKGSLHGYQGTQDG
jgi:hypothetical protein